MRRMALAALAAVTMFVAVPAAAQTEGSESPEIDKLVAAFFGAREEGGVVTAQDPTQALSPFGGNSLLPADAVGPVTLDGTFTGFVNLGPNPALPDADLDGTLDYPDRPVRPPFDDGPFPFVDVPLDQLPPLGGDRLVVESLAGLLAEVGAPLGDVRVVAGDPGAAPPDGVWSVTGGRTAAPIPLGCPGTLFELGRADALTGMPLWEPQSFAPNDMFAGTSQAIVTRCSDGRWEVERLVNEGSSFASMPTGTVTIVTPGGWLSFTPGDEVPDPAGHRLFAFTTPLATPYQPDTVGFTTAPPFPELAPPEGLTILSDPATFLPGPPLASFPLVIDFTAGSCPPETWSGSFELFALDGGDVFLEQVTTGQTATGTATPAGDGLDIALSGSGPGYEESYQLSGPAGTYTHTDDGTACTWTATVGSPYAGFWEEILALATPVETTSTTAAPATTGEPASSPEGGSILPWVLIVLGLLLLGGGAFLFFRPKDPCEELRKRWEAAEARRRTIAEELGKAEAYLDECETRRTGLEAELAELERASAIGSVTEGGVEYKVLPGEGRVTAEGLDEIIASTRAHLESARGAEASAAESVSRWEANLAEAAAAAAAAKAAYDACVGAATAPEAPVASSPGGPAVATTPGGVATTPEGCPPGEREARPLGDAVRFRVCRAFRVETETEGGSAIGEGAQPMVADLRELAAGLGVLGALLGAKGAGESVAGGVTSAAGGKALAGAGGIAWGGVGGVLAAKGNLGTSEFPVPVPTSGPEVVAGTLQLIAQLAALVAGKADEWVGRRQITNYTLVREYQTVTIRRFEIWVCDGSTWSCDQRVNEYELGAAQALRSNPVSGRATSELDRHRLAGELRRLVAVGRSSMESSARPLLEWEAANPPGPCQ